MKVLFIFAIAFLLSGYSASAQMGSDTMITIRSTYHIKVSDSLTRDSIVEVRHYKPRHIDPQLVTYPPVSSARPQSLEKPNFFEGAVVVLGAAYILNELSEPPKATVPTKKKN